MSEFVVAIDGPSGSGKSSVSKAVAKRLGFGYLDTGAAYRALTWALQHGNVSPNALEAGSVAEHFSYSISTDPSNFWVRWGDIDITDAIREPAVAEGVSAVAKIMPVREFMKSLTRQIAQECERPGIVIEGRDITTVVMPQAQKRILLTASEAVRLKRRSAELSNLGETDLQRQVIERDANDSKVVDFLTPAPGVQLVDSSELNFEQTVSALLEVIGFAGLAEDTHA